MSTTLTGGPGPSSAGLSWSDVIDLDRRIDGSVLSPSDAGWPDAVRVWNGTVRARPAYVVRPAHARDVAATVDLARERGVRLGVKGGGHNIGGSAVPDGGLMIDLSPLRRVEVDPAHRLAHVGGGCLLRDVDAATQEHGLATTLGFYSGVGVGGLVLGGGFGYLARRFGWAVDNLEEAEVVTADGRVRTASRQQHPDLLWGLRGGGGNLGVVTRLTLRLHPVGPIVHGGLIAWPFERAEEVMSAYRRLIQSAPRELTVYLVLLYAPPAPFVPPVWHGRPLVAFVVCWSGDLARTREALTPVHALGDPVVDLLQDWPYTTQQSFLDDGEPAGDHYYWRTEFAASLTEEMLARCREAFTGCPVPRGQVIVAHLGGALNERAWDDGAVGNRDVRFVYGAAADWDPDDPRGEEYVAWTRAAGDRLRAFSTGAMYVNFQTSEDGLDRLRATYGPNWDRLVEVKRRWDPQNLFRGNRNVPVE